jgi:Macrocin-O-methyltransferase (TylF)
MDASPCLPHLRSILPVSAGIDAARAGRGAGAKRVDKKMGAKILLTRLGSVCSGNVIYNLNGAFNYLHVGWWLRSHGFRPRTRVPSHYGPRARDELFRLIAAEVGERNVLYLEFGVAAGASMKQWSELLRNPRSSLHGFDSFSGLPHDWSLEGHERGSFSTGGQQPKIDDPRVQFFTGWFDETLPSYQWPEHEQLVVVMDADLYSSTSTALDHVKARLVPGSYLYFDQFHHRCDETRAFTELLDENSFRFELFAASRDLSKVVFKQLP